MDHYDIAAGLVPIVIEHSNRGERSFDIFSRLPACLVGMEACGSAHHWGRALLALDHDVKLMPELRCQFT